MSGVLVLWTGKRGAPAWEQLVEEYRLRVSRHMPAAEVRLRPAEGRAGDPGRVLAFEARQLAAHLAAGDVLVALDERGEELDSEALARWLGARRQCSRVVMAIGSDLGLEPGFVERADLRLALSRLTLPHQLARLVLWEQLYRAADLLAGGSYHRGAVGRERPGKDQFAGPSPAPRGSAGGRV
ncbi:MAG TPA: 23S rRNA (pseudouridine(1915)-N(3))-methyltransferase RlmH [Thermoanaerobaculaceae bacterium]|nr:23S rRNA (pseudouridine(1915)-N(3))-methyltransferase RlmH [Thermoanaerobaculaceae bacterium]HRS15521.1 23S rRNA (pseudouridine(1915)-N(3))-methyltransferase RlmH [Thermoanaerobaculaceae bacterium]